MAVASPVIGSTGSPDRAARHRQHHLRCCRWQPFAESGSLELPTLNLFLTGTDTNVGKSYIAALLVRALRAAGHDCVGLKPICCGGREDATLLHEEPEGAITLNDVNTEWLRTPAATDTASLIENSAI